MKLSIIIPCYNHGLYLRDAIGSLPSQNDLPFELIIVNDGSTDEFTVRELETLKRLGYNILSHQNQGLAYSRNRGIQEAKGEYILPLDADNKVIAQTLVEAVKILDQGEFDIVYGKPKFFGEDIDSRKFIPKPFVGDELFFTNYIDACAIYKKAVWVANKGYDGNMPHQGNEDWEFWLNSYINGSKFFFLNKDCYEYRISSESMLSSIMNNEKSEINHTYIITKHNKHFVDAFIRHYAYSSMYRNDLDHPLRSVFKHFYHLLKK